MTHTILCPGKINLFLDVTGKTDNGYHEILTLFLPVKGLEDKITVDKSDSLKILCNHPGVPVNSSNLCWQAAELFASVAGIPSNWQISIEKKLPVAGGMGGGSSNAGRLLSLLALMFPNKVSEEKLKEIALRIGADVPFFLNPVPSLATGIGEKIVSLKSAKTFHIILITFEFPISAAWAYKNRKLKFNSSGMNSNKVRSAWESGDIQEIIYNDLGFAVADKFPIIQGALDDLKEAGAINSIVSGSGPTVFGIFESESLRDNALENLISKKYPKENLFPANIGYSV